MSLLSLMISVRSKYLPSLCRIQIIHYYRLAKIEIGRLAEPSDIAQTVALLASDPAAFITGQILSVNGGYITAD